LYAAIIATILGSMIVIANSKTTDIKEHNFYKFILLSIAISEIVFAIIFLFNKEFFINNSFIASIIGLSIVGTLFSSIFLYYKVRTIDENVEKASLDLGANY
jgi:ABC-type spermidine/putrescine transport system permease subunit II